MAQPSDRAWWQFSNKDYMHLLSSQTRSGQCEELVPTALGTCGWRLHLCVQGYRGGTCDVTRVWKLLVFLLLAEAVRAARVTSDAPGHSRGLLTSDDTAKAAHRVT